ncbi:hypothetical protein GW846_03155 [Candidatus Gracilibacteria bacterium]|nr:hypothetical protein [Candidatus Gracilibacteria bacterium]
MFYNLNSYEINIVIAGKKYYMGKISHEKKGEIISATQGITNNKKLRKVIIPFIHQILKKLNNGYLECKDGEILDEEIINFITKIKC